MHAMVIHHVVNAASMDIPVLFAGTSSAWGFSSLVKTILNKVDRRYDMLPQESDQIVSQSVPWDITVNHDELDHGPVWDSLRCNRLACFSD